MTKCRLIRDQRGTSVIELAIAAPILSLFLIGMVDLSRAYSAKLQVEQAAHRTIEKVQRNGFTLGDQTSLQTEAETAAGAGSSATVVASLECTASGGTVTVKAFNQTCSDTDTFARYVRVQITKAYTPMFRLRFGVAANANYTLHGNAALRVQ
jgi:Flp pilus assembly protein TadG